jgi:hypothetical protein
MTTSHSNLFHFADNYKNGNDAVEAFTAPVRRPVSVKDCLWEFLRMQPINEPPSRTITQSLCRATASAQGALETTTFTANVYSDKDRIIFEFPRTGFLDPASIQLAFNLRGFVTTHNNADNEGFNYDIGTMFTRIRLLYNEHEIEDIQRSDLLSHVQSCLFDTPMYQESQHSFLTGKHKFEDYHSAQTNESRFFNRRSYHNPSAVSGNVQPFGLTRRYMMPLPIGLFRQKRPIPLHMFNGNLRIELTVAEFKDVIISAIVGEPQPAQSVGRLELGRVLLHAKVFKQGLGNVDGIFNSMLSSNALVYGFQSYQYNQFTIPTPTNANELQSFQPRQSYPIKANLKYARYLIACITSPLNINYTSTQLYNSWYNVQTKNAAGFHMNNQIRKLSQLYSFQLEYDGTPVTPEIKCSTNPHRYYKTVYANATAITDNPAADDVSSNMVEPFYYYNQAVPLTCGEVVTGRHVSDFFQGYIDNGTTSVVPVTRNDQIAFWGSAPLIMMIPLSSILPNGEVAALELGSGNEVLNLRLVWNSPPVDVMLAAIADPTLPTPLPPPILLNTFICYDRLLTVKSDGSIVFEQ